MRLKEKRITFNPIINELTRNKQIELKKRYKYLFIGFMIGFISCSVLLFFIIMARS